MSARYRFPPIPTRPVMVHLTTADLGNLADGRYKSEERIFDSLAELNAVLLMTVEHFIEFIPLTDDSRTRRFGLAARTPVVLAKCAPEQLWSTPWANQPSPLQLPPRRVTPEELASEYRDAEDEIRLIRAMRLRASEGQFFSRIGNHLNRGMSQGDSDDRLQKFHRYNEKHGSDLRGDWEDMRYASAEQIEQLKQEALKHQSPEAIQWLNQLQVQLEEACAQGPAAAKAWSKRLERQLRRARRQAAAENHGVAPENPCFLVWWQTKQKLLAKVDEVGGLGEEIDLQEIKWWPFCAMTTVDRRVFNAINEAVRGIDSVNGDSVMARFVRAGSEKRLIARLRELVEA